MKPRKLYILLEATTAATVSSIKAHFKGAAITGPTLESTIDVGNVKVDVVQPLASRPRTR